MAITLPERRPSMDIPNVGGERYDIGDIVIDFHPEDVQEHFFISPLEAITFPVGGPLKVSCALDTDVIKPVQLSNQMLGFVNEGSTVFARANLLKHNLRLIAVNYPASTRIDLQEAMQIKSATLTANNYRSSAPETTLALSRLFQEFIATGFRGGRLVAESLLCLAIVHAIEVAEKSQASGDPKQIRRIDPMKLSRTLEYMEDNLANNLSLAEIASIANLSNYHFLRCFKMSTGMPPYTYLLHRRVERAKRLLGQNQLTILSIAMLCGFNSQSHFSTVFKKLTGITPSKYRFQSRR